MSLTGHTSCYDSVKTPNGAFTLTETDTRQIPTRWYPPGSTDLVSTCGFHVFHLGGGGYSGTLQF